MDEKLLLDRNNLQIIAYVNCDQPIQLSRYKLDKSLKFE